MKGISVAVVGAYEAKTRLAELLTRVEQGEQITITRRGRPIAVLIPAVPQTGPTRDEAIAELRGFGTGRSLGGLSIRELIEEGRRA